MNKETMKKEALRRMRMMGIYEPTVKQFENSDLVSESLAPFGACYWLNDEQKERVKDMEERYNILVYHVIHSFTDIGEMESYLFVTKDKNEWELDNEDIKQNYALAYVYNNDYPEFSEFGTIGFKRTIAHGLTRTF